MLHRSEHHGESETDAVFGAVGGGVVVHAADILNLEETQDATHARGDFPIGHAGIHDARVVGERHEHAAAGILREEGVVLVGESAPQHLDAEVFAQAGFLDEGDAVEDLALHVPVEVDTPETVVEELHIGNLIEHLLTAEVRQVGSRHAQQGEGHLVPLLSDTAVEVDAPPAVEPDALEEAKLGVVVVVFAPEEAIDAHGVAEGEDGCLAVDFQTAYLGIGVECAGGVFDFGLELGGAKAYRV